MAWKTGSCAGIHPEADHRRRRAPRAAAPAPAGVSRYDGVRPGRDDGPLGTNSRSTDGGGDARPRARDRPGRAGRRSVPR